MSKLPIQLPEGTMFKSISPVGLDVIIATSNYKIEGYLWAYYVSSEGISRHETVHELNLFLEGRMDLDIKDLERDPSACMKFLDMLIERAEETGDDISLMKRYAEKFIEDIQRSKRPNNNPHLDWMKQMIEN